jgi:hypothetical protein
VRADRRGGFASCVMWSKMVTRHPRFNPTDVSTA